LIKIPREKRFYIRVKHRNFALLLSCSRSIISSLILNRNNMLLYTEPQFDCSRIINNSKFFLIAAKVWHVILCQLFLVQEYKYKVKAEINESKRNFGTCEVPMYAILHWHLALYVARCLCRKGTTARGKYNSLRFQAVDHPIPV